MPDNRNFILAIALSLAVLIGWTYFVSGPQIEQARIEQERLVAEQAAQQDSDGIAVPSGETGAPSQSTDALPTEDELGGGATREDAVAASTRIPIETELLSGSINLAGARLDDLRLNNYHETVDDSSPTIVLLSPSGGPNGFFAEFGWQGDEALGEVPAGTTEWQAPAGATLTAETPVTLTYDNGQGLVFNRTIAVDDAYLFTITDSVTNTTDATADLTPYGRLTRIGQPVISGFWILHEGMIGVFGDDGLNEWDYDDIADEGAASWTSVSNGWLGITDKYWAASLIPDRDRPFDGRFVHSANADVYQADFRQGAIAVAPQETVDLTNHLFAGAKVVSIVDGYQQALDIQLFDRIIDWGWFWFITKPLFSMIDWFFKLFGNFGVAILGATVVIKAFFFPLASKSYKSMSAMKKVQPEMTKIREQYKDDRAEQQKALMELYKEKKINPLAGCWPIAIQIPVFFALYKVLFVTIEMRHAPFFGWIQDLAAPDPTTLFNLFGLIPWDPPSLLIVGVWPLIMGITMFVQMRLNPTPPDPTQAMIFTWMPVVFTFMLASFPAGLVIYWAWNNTLSIIQQYVIMRREGAEVNLLGNIMDTFRKKKKSAATPEAAKPVAEAANDDSADADNDTDKDAEAEAAKAPAEPVKPADPDRRVKPKKSRNRTRGKSGGKSRKSA